jgi:hypothetical protein
MKMLVRLVSVALAAGLVANPFTLAEDAPRKPKSPRPSVQTKGGIDLLPKISMAQLPG